MKMLLRIAVGLLILVAIVAGGGIAYAYLAYPKSAPAPNLHIESTPERVARGQYLANNVADCFGCHSEVDWTRQPPQLKPGTFGRGGERWDPETAGMPGIVYSPNLTPAGIGSWTDGELFRAITTGIAKDGRPLFPLMSYPAFAKIDEDDVHAIIAYLRTLPPIEHTVPAPVLDFPINLIARAFPGPASLKPRPAVTDKVAYGGYLVTMADCGGCHTKTDNYGRPSPDAFAGGQEFRFPPHGYRVQSANITPDADTGIGSWTEEQFITKFKGFEAPSDHVINDAEERQNTVMPWVAFTNMTRDDLSAIYAYLRTLKPIVNRVNTHPDQLSTGGR